MTRQSNPYAGQYSPSRVALGKNDIVKGLKGIKVKAPNKNLSSTEYKTGLKKEPEA